MCCRSSLSILGLASCSTREDLLRYRLAVRTTFRPPRPRLTKSLTTIAPRRPILRHLDLCRPGSLYRRSLRHVPRRGLVPRRTPARPPHGGEPVPVRGGRSSRSAHAERQDRTRRGGERFDRSVFDGGERAADHARGVGESSVGSGAFESEGRRAFLLEAVVWSVLFSLFLPSRSSIAPCPVFGSSGHHRFFFLGALSLFLHHQHRFPPALPSAPEDSRTAQQTKCHSIHNLCRSSSEPPCIMFVSISSHDSFHNTYQSSRESRRLASRSCSSSSGGSGKGGRLARSRGGLGTPCKADDFPSPPERRTSGRVVDFAFVGLVSGGEPSCLALEVLDVARIVVAVDVPLALLAVLGRLGEGGAAYIAKAKRRGQARSKDQWAVLVYFGTRACSAHLDRRLKLFEKCLPLRIDSSVGDGGGGACAGCRRSRLLLLGGGGGDKPGISTAHIPKAPLHSPRRLLSKRLATSPTLPA